MIYRIDYFIFISFNTGEEDTLKAIQAYDRFTRLLRSIDLPLGISGIHSTSEVIRHSRVFPPKPHFVQATKVSLIFY